MSDMKRFSVAIVEDDGTDSLHHVARQFDTDDQLRLTNSQLRALLDGDRAIMRTKGGQKLVVENYPDIDRAAPVEIRETETDTAQEGREDE